MRYSIKALTAIYNYQNEYRAKAKGKRIANDRTRENADANYLANIAKIDKIDQEKTKPPRKKLKNYLKIII